MLSVRKALRRATSARVYLPGQPPHLCPRLKEPQQTGFILIAYKLVVAFPPLPPALPEEGAEE